MVAVRRTALEPPALQVDVLIAVGDGGPDGHHLSARFSLDDGILVMFGPSGSGKTLTVRAVAGLVRPAAGTIRVRGETLFDAAASIHVAPERRRVSYVPQHVSLFPHLNVQDNVAFGLRASGMRREAADIAEEWLRRLGVLHLAERAPRNLSGGESQRVALARALAPEPRMVLLDEPFASLDMSTRREMRQVVRRMQQQSRIPMVFVTHSPGEALKMGDRLVRYAPGGSVEEGLPSELLEMDED